MRQSIAFLCDFDGTIGIQDVGDLVLDNLVFPRIPPAILQEIAASGAGSKQLYSQWYGNAPPSHEEFHELIMEAGIDPLFKALCELAEHQGDRVAIVSDGFDAYIQPILKRASISGIPVYSNGMSFNSKLELSFPHHNPTCRFCGVCKAAIAMHYARKGDYIVYVGDGTSDRFPVHIAHKVFAKDALVDICDQEGVTYTKFGSFQDIIDWYAEGKLEQGKLRDLHEKCQSLEEDRLEFLDQERATQFLSIG